MGFKNLGEVRSQYILVAGRLEQVGVLRRRGVFVCIQDLSRFSSSPLVAQMARILLNIVVWR